jgi:hypothetical protein
VQAFFDRWLQRLPWPLTAADRAAGYRHRLSIWQLEMSLTHVFTAPVYGRHFFEAVIRDNLDLGRPDRVSLLFPTRLQRNTPPPGLGYKTRVITRGVAPSLHVEFKHSHVKQYFKEQRALRTETTINDPLDFQRTKGLETLPHLQSIGRQINTKLLDVEQVADGAMPLVLRSSTVFRPQPHHPLDSAFQRSASATNECRRSLAHSAASAICPTASVTATCVRW